jgi:hypothetical protein
VLNSLGAGRAATARAESRVEVLLKLVTFLVAAAPMLGLTGGDTRE